MPKPDRESPDKRGPSPRSHVSLRAVVIRPDRRVSDGKLDYKAQAPLPDATGMAQTCPQTSGFDRSSDDPERGRQCRFFLGSDAANRRPSAAPNRIRRGPYDRPTAHREAEGTPRGNPAAPTTLVRGRRPGPFLARRSL